jgi:hypothetical protein
MYPAMQTKTMKTFQEQWVFADGRLLMTNRPKGKPVAWRILLKGAIQ